MVAKTCSCRRWDLRGIPCTHGCQALFSMNDNLEDKVDSCYSKSVYMQACQQLLRTMKGSMHWPKTGLPDILPPKARRIPGRPKKHRRKEQGEEGAGEKLSKKGILMKCSACLTPGHNKATCIATPEEIEEKKRAVAEAKKAQSEAAKAEATLKKKATLDYQKKKQQVKKGPSVDMTNSNQKVGQKKKRGRPPKNQNVKVQQRPTPVGIGVFTSQADGHTYYSTTTRTVRISTSQPTTTNLGDSNATTEGASQPLSSSTSFMFRGKMVYNKSSN